MHVAQIMLVEFADDADEVLSYVDARLSDYLEGSGGTWFDWFGGLGEGLAGRWTGSVVEQDWMRYSDDPEKFEEVIDKFMEQRLANLEYAQTSMRGLDLATATYGERDEFDMQVYGAYKAAKLLQDFWTEDSAIYDLDSGTANLRWFRERVKENPTQQFLVVVDFHF